MLCRLLSWENSCLIFPASFHRDTATTMEGIVTMYQDFMKKAGQCLALPSYQTGSTTCFSARGTGGGLSSLKHPLV